MVHLMESFHHESGVTYTPQLVGVSRSASTANLISVALGGCGCTWTDRKASQEG